MTKAIVGDAHGNLKQMYSQVSKVKPPVEVIYQLGDFHAIRDETDLRHFPCPGRHKKLGDFPFYNTQGSVPIPTFFIGGNHENYHWLSQFPEGAKILQNLHYLGRAGTKKIAGKNIAWLSGVYSPNPFSDGKRKPQHFTPQDLENILQNPEDIDILLMHDWPSIRKLQPHIQEGTISNPELLQKAIHSTKGKDPSYDSTANLIIQTKPKQVFCGHVHHPLQFDLNIDGSITRFTALPPVGSPNAIHLID